MFENALGLVCARHVSREELFWTRIDFTKAKSRRLSGQCEEENCCAKWFQIYN